MGEAKRRKEAGDVSTPEALKQWRDTQQELTAKAKLATHKNKPTFQIPQPANWQRLGPRKPAKTAIEQAADLVESTDVKK